MLPHPFTNFKIQKYYQNKPKFNGVYSRNNLPRITDEANLINPDEFKSIRTHWIALYLNNNVSYFDSFGVEHILKEIEKFMENKNTITNTYWIQEYDLVMCQHLCIGFIDFYVER